MIPDWRRGNPYLNLLASSLKDVEVNFGDLTPGLFPLNRMASKNPGVDIFHLHWVNDLLAPAIWPSTATRRFIRRSLLAADVLLLRLRGRRVVWTIHNYVAHESTEESLELKARSTLARFVSHNIVHSPSALRRVREGYGAKGLADTRVSVIRHGNYDGCYPVDEEAVASLRQYFSISSEQVVILFLGAVRPYKGLERLLNAFLKSQRGDLRLVIAGRPNSPEYEASLKNIVSSDPRILFEPEFVPSSKVSAYYAIADVVAMPFERILTSGSAILAMTQGKAMILPEHARELDLVDEAGAIYFSDEKHLENIFNDLQSDVLRSMGRVNRDIAENAAWPAIAQQTMRAYGEGLG